ncbi:adenosine receptor A3-like [Nematostella vectensis]|uniref:adenosine receptor A3-like n=1 Tax=Nematostella vectensis TaxID=45351 RepID=UPI002076E4A2|nr:adenosine receptor A3-like [Nematostella vectensis]
MLFNYSCYHFTKWVQEGQITRTEFTIVAVLNGITILPATILNVLILVSIWRTPALHRPSIILMSNLALADIGVGAVAQPLMLIWAALELNVENWPMSTYCYVAAFFGNSGSVFGAVSLLSVTAIAFDRFLALHYHLRYTAIVTVKRVSFLCFIFWFISLLCVVVWFVLGNSIYSYMAGAVMVMCFGVVLLSYYNVYKVIKRHQKQINTAQSSFSEEASSAGENANNMKKYKKSVLNSLLIYFVFIACSTPFVCAITYFEITQDNSLSPTLFRLSTSLLFANSAINPIIYCCKMKELREAVYQSVTSLNNHLGIAKIEEKERH